VNQKIADSVERAKSLVRPMFKDRQRTAIAMKIKFPGFDPTAVKKRLALVEKITGNRLDVKFYGPTLMSLMSDRA
jgi:hypothetical protein